MGKRFTAYSHILVLIDFRGDMGGSAWIAACVRAGDGSVGRAAGGDGNGWWWALMEKNILPKISPPRISDIYGDKSQKKPLGNTIAN